MKKIGIDIDGVLCPEVAYHDKPTVETYAFVVEQINILYNSGHRIIFYTARGWHEYDYTYEWLVENGFLFHQLICGKPIFDIVCDDRSYKNIKELYKELTKNDQQ